MKRIPLLLSIAATLAGCGACPKHAAQIADPLGNRPAVAEAPPLALARPSLFTLSNGLGVWLVERHTLPVVSFALAVPTGSSRDPEGKAGLAHATATMLDEGAGARDALELSRAVELLGATLETRAGADASYVTMTTLKRNLAPATAILGDVVARPRFAKDEWIRVHDLWQNELRARASDPGDVAEVVTRVALFGAAHPYGHPVEGLLASASKVTLEDVTQFHRAWWTPERSTLVVVGDVTRAELEAALAPSLGTWKNENPPCASCGPLPGALVTPSAEGPFPRVVLVDRPDAPQTVITVVRPGIAAADPDAPIAERANIALGGSFTSRLNQDLREEHGWSYGARSHVALTRGPGFVSASAAVHTEKTAEALVALLHDVDVFANRGLTEDEIGKTRLTARSNLIDALETTEGMAHRLARDAALGLGPDHQARASLRSDEATKTEMDAVAKRLFDPTRAVVVLVGPRAELAPELAKRGFPHAVLVDAEGAPIPAAR